MTKWGLSDKDRFLSHVDRNGPTMHGMIDNCWSWLAAVWGPKHTNPLDQIVRYGCFWFIDRMTNAHVVAYILFRLNGGQIPKQKNGKRKYVLHRCHNPICVNPDHLYLGTQKENMEAMVAAGRSYCLGPKNPAKGSAHGKAKLTEDDVKEIRRLWLTGNWTKKQLARRSNVSGWAIWNIVHYKTWKSVA